MRCKAASLTSSSFTSWLFLSSRDKPRVVRPAPIVRVAPGLYLLCAIFLLVFGASSSVAQDSYLVKIEGEGLVTLNATNVPLNNLLQALSRRIPLEIRGGVAPDERITVQFSRLPLKEALGKMIRNYNYVLVTPEGSERSILTIINPVTRAPAREEAPSVATMKGSATPGAPQGAPPAPGRPPAIQDETQSDTDPNRPPVQERRDAPRAAPLGIQPGPTMPAPPPGSLPQSKPQGVTEAPGLKEAQAPPIEPVPSASPETVMTPFGFRNVTPPEAESSPGPGAVQTPAGILAPGSAPSSIRTPQGRPAP